MISVKKISEAKEDVPSERLKDIKEILLFEINQEGFFYTHDFHNWSNIFRYHKKDKEKVFKFKSCKKTVLPSLTKGIIYQVKRIK